MNAMAQCGCTWLFSVAALLVGATGALAQPAPAASEPVAAKPGPSTALSSPQSGAPKIPSTKAWSELSAPQQLALRPLAADWKTIDEAQKRKWLAVSQNFATLTPAEQAKLHSRMTEWVSLSPRQRTEARLNFAETKQVPADEKRAKWEAYQALSPEEKSRLAASAAPKPIGAATAVKPVPAQKLATPPNAKPPAAGASGAASAPRQVDQKTLLPRKPANAP